MATTMASMLHPPNRLSSSARNEATANDGLLPLDLVYNILLRLLVKPICRFCAVCTSWHSLLCHPDFITAAHGPLIAVGVCHDGPGHVVDILDMDSSVVIERVNIDATWSLPDETPTVSPARAVRVNNKDGRLCLIDPVTGAGKLLPDPPSSHRFSTWRMLGCMAFTFTGEYKLLAIANSIMQERQICKILTLDDNGGERSRETGSPLLSVELPSPPSTYSREITVVEGVAYFLVTCQARTQLKLNKHHRQIMAFDLGSEAWKPAALPGPTSVMWRYRSTLATLEGQLVACHDDQSSVELWFLVDPYRPLWSMRHKIVTPCHKLWSPQPPGTSCEYFGNPLAVLDDRRIVMWMWMPVATQGYVSNMLNVMLRFYDLKTGAFSDGM